MDKNMEIQRNNSDGTMNQQHHSSRERKLALLQDVDYLKRKLRHEENVHKALERAFRRPLGALPRLPPYLPQQTLELLAEVAVLEEEVVMLEERVVDYRRGLDQKAMYTFSRRNRENFIDNAHKSCRGKHSRSMSLNEAKFDSSLRPQSLLPSLSRTSSRRKFLSDTVSDKTKHCFSGTLNGGQLLRRSNSFSENGLGKENCSSTNDKKAVDKNTPVVRNAGKLPRVKHKSAEKCVHSQMLQCRSLDQENTRQSTSSSSDERISRGESSDANKISEDVLKCLSNIFLILSTSKKKTMESKIFSSSVALAFEENTWETEFRDPYGICSKSRTRDIGPYGSLYAIEACSIDLKRKTKASFLIDRLKLLLSRLASVNLKGLTHQQKLAFWINTYNSCMMNAFLGHGIPKNRELVIALMQKATIIVGGQLLNAITIEHFILRLPYHLKHMSAKSEKTDEMKVRSIFGFDWSEPSVTFALSCGSRSSPAVRVYTASQVEEELEESKRDYLQAAVGISTNNKLIIPKLLDWYLLDFAKDLEAMLYWVCLQLPDEHRYKMVRLLERRGREPLSRLVQIMPYDFSFRYLFHKDVISDGRSVLFR